MGGDRQTDKERDREKGRDSVTDTNVTSPTTEPYGIPNWRESATDLRPLTATVKSHTAYDLNQDESCDVSEGKCHDPQCEMYQICLTVHANLNRH